MRMLTRPDVIRYLNFVNLVDIKLYLIVILVCIPLINKVGGTVMVLCVNLAIISSYLIKH